MIAETVEQYHRRQRQAIGDGEGHRWTRSAWHLLAERWYQLDAFIWRLSRGLV